MFRYLSLAWNASSADQSAFAHGVERELGGRPGWHNVFGTAGHRVFVNGNVPSINDAYVLPRSQGVILGRLFRTDPAHAIAGDIELTDAEGQRIVDSAGRTLIEKYWGRYVAFLPALDGQPRVLRDPTGTLPCYQSFLHGVSIVFSWLEDLVSLPDVGTPKVCEDAIGAHLLFGQIGGVATSLEGITQVMPGELTSMSSSASPAPTRLWSAVDVARTPFDASMDELARRLHDTVLGCAQSWVSCYDSLLLRLSGGVDSSILLGALSAALRPERLTCINYHESPRVPRRPFGLSQAITAEV